MIELTNNIEELEKSYEDFNSLSYNLRKNANAESINKYGMDVDSFYTLLKSELSKDSDREKETVYNKSDGTLYENYLELSDEDLQNKIQDAKIKEKEGHIIIAPYCVYNLYTLEELNSKYNKYNMLPQNLKDLSDAESVAIFGDNVINMYEKCKNDILSAIKNTKDAVLEPTRYVDVIQNESDDELYMIKKKYELELINASCSIVESAIIENGINSIHKSIPSNFGLLDISIIHSLNINSFEEYYELVKENFNDKEKLLSLGYNPNRPLLEASEIEREYLEEIGFINKMFKIPSYEDNIEVDQNLVNDKLYPIYIVLSFSGSNLGKIINKVKHSNYSHAAISFDESLEELYSFNMNLNSDNYYTGMVQESLQSYIKVYRDAKIRVLSIFVTKDQYNKILARFNYYVNNAKNSKYDIPNLFRNLINKPIPEGLRLKMVCSQFVDAMLRAADIDLTGKSNNLVAPADFEKLNNTKVYLAYEGLARQYNPTKVKIKSDILRLDRDNAIKLESRVFDNRLDAIQRIVESKNLINCMLVSLKEDKDAFVDIYNLLKAEPISNRSTINESYYEYSYSDILL